MRRARTTIVHGLTIVATVVFLGVLLAYLPRPGYTPVRLLFVMILGGVAVLGGVGVVWRIERLTAVSVGGLLLLGFWQAVLWIYIFPFAGILAIASILDDTEPDE